MLQSKRNILFRCDQNFKSGFGHFSRCLNFARLLIKEANFKPFFIGNYHNFSIELLKKYKIEYKQIESKDFSFFDASFFTQFEYIVIDSYLYQQDYIKKIVALPIFTIFIDDECILDFTNADLVINFRVGQENLKYASKQKALGANHFIYKPELLEIRKNKTSTETIKSVLLFFGGLGLSAKYVDTIIKSLHEINEKIKIYYLSNDFSYLTKNSKDKIIPIKPTFEIEKVLTLVDCVINGGGLIKYECAFCKIPSASISTTKLQYEDTLVLTEKKLIFDLGYVEETSEELLSENVKKFVLSKTFKQEFVEASEMYFTEKSVDNILELIN